MSALEMSPAEAWTLEQVLAWRRVRMPWADIARNLRMPVDAVKAKYEGATRPAPLPPAPRPCPAEAPRPRSATRVRPAVKAPGSKPRRARSVPAPLNLTDDLKIVALTAAVTALNLPEAAVRQGQFGHRKASIAAAYAFSRFRGCPKAQAALAFGAYSQHLCPSGMASWSISDAAIAAILNALYAARGEP